MCKYSLESYKSRDAVEGETLTANIHYSGHRGTLGLTNYTFACVKHEQKLTVENVQFINSMRFLKAIDEDYAPHDGDFNKRVTYANTALYRGMLTGKRHVVTLLDGQETDSGYDYIEFENGVLCSLSSIERGVTFYVGVKPTLEDKLHLDEASLRAIAADDPNPKPEDEEEKDEEPAKEEPKPNTVASAPSFDVRRLVRLNVRNNDDF